MPKPLLQHVQRDALANRRYTKTVPESLWRSVRSLLYLNVAARTVGLESKSPPHPSCGRLTSPKLLPPSDNCSNASLKHRGSPSASFFSILTRAGPWGAPDGTEVDHRHGAQSILVTSVIRQKPGRWSLPIRGVSRNPNERTGGSIASQCMSVCQRSGQDKLSDRVKKRESVDC